MYELNNFLLIDTLKPSMTYPKEDFKKFFLPVYLVWGIVNPILLMIPKSFYGLFVAFSWNGLLRFVSFYMIFGGIWPLTIIVYPAFLSSPEVTSDPFYLTVTYIALVGPILTFILQLIRHKKFVEERKGEPITFSDYLWDFI
ncbi:MAG: hypothetical protein D6732_05580 [Methanobacteriota archaeon]|nr:MAG: hypothetical protein D6732_05580 [Euryarchaeota archaeon]